MDSDNQVTADDCCGASTPRSKPKRIIPQPRLTSFFKRVEKPEAPPVSESLVEVFEDDNGSQDGEESIMETAEIENVGIGGLVGDIVVLSSAASKN